MNPVRLQKIALSHKASEACTGYQSLTNIKKLSGV